MGVRAALALGALETWAQTSWAGSCSRLPAGVFRPTCWCPEGPSGGVGAAPSLRNPQGGPKSCPASPGAASRRPHLHQRIGDLVVDLLGEVVHEVGAVEGELLGGLVGGAGVLDEALAARRVHRHHGLAVQLPLPLVHGAAAHHHLHRLRGHRAAAGLPRAGPDFAVGTDNCPAGEPGPPGAGDAARAGRRGRALVAGTGLRREGGTPRGASERRKAAARESQDRSRGRCSFRGRARLSLRPGPGGEVEDPRCRRRGTQAPSRPLALKLPRRSRLHSNARGVTGGGSRERARAVRALPPGVWTGVSPARSLHAG